jgi:PAS domain S-box-containing protein
MAELNYRMISPSQTSIESGIRSLEGPEVCFAGQEQLIMPIEIEVHKPVEETLRDREHELSQLINMVPSHLWRLTPEGEPTFFNKRMVDFLGLDVPDMDKPGISRLEAVIETVHPHEAAEFRDTLNRCLVTGEHFTMRYRLRRADGVYRWMSSRAEPMRDPGGHIVQWYGLCHDIDDQMHAEEALRQSERQLQQMIDAVPVRIWSVTSMDGPVYFNKRYQDHFRAVIPDFEAIEEPRIETLLQELIYPEDAPEVQRTLLNCFESGRGTVMRFRWLEKDGAYRWAECRVEPRRDQDGTIVQWYGVSLDIDDEVRAQEALRNRERELSLLVDMVPSNLWRLTPDGETTLANKHMADFLGVDLEDKRQLAVVFDAIFHPDDVDAVSDVLGRCLKTGELFSMKYRLRRHDGVYRWMSGRAEPLRAPDGRIAQWFGLCHDIDDQVHAEEALRRASEQLARATQAASLAELSASIAHEVNQPLAAIVANSHACHRWLSAEPPNVERAKTTAERITRDANSAADVVSRIRALFRQAPRARSSENINHLIGEVCQLMADGIAAKGIRIETNLEPDLPSVALDRVQVQQVFVNLVRNGVEAMDGAIVDGARALQISSLRDGNDAIRIEVRDAGTGFEDTERVFQPFFTTKQHGMGMGLAICRSIIESHGGRLWMANNETRGATVAFTLPLEASEAP